jgi:RNA polymerase sigma-70 factor (ECF subfamily)
MGAFEMLYRRHKDRLFAYLMSTCGHRDVAAELFQDVWAKVIGERDAYTVTGKFAGWLYRVAHNRLMDHFRAQPRQPGALDDIADPPAPEIDQPERRVQSAHVGRSIARALALLPAEQRTAFLLKEEGELSLDEIAQATGVGRETVKSRLRYALVKLREELADV